MSAQQPAIFLGNGKTTLWFDGKDFGKPLLESKHGGIEYSRELSHSECNALLNDPYCLFKNMQLTA
jgi:hypothetical protein